MIISLPRFSSPWLLLALGALTTLFIGFIFALFGWFSPVITSILLLIMGASLGYSFFLLFQSRDWPRIFLLLSLALLATFIALRTEPSIFSGRDQGSLALAAWNLATEHELAQNSSLSRAFFEVYGPGRALNFPGFSYANDGSLLPHFPLGYITFLAIFVSWFKVSGFLLGNAILLILSGWTFFELLSTFVSRRNALFGTVLFAFSFLSVWLTQITLTENLALFLFLTLTLSLLSFNREPKFDTFLAIILSGFLFSMTRIEGFIIFPIALLFILLRSHLRAFVLANPFRHLGIPILIMSFLFLRDFFMNLPFYTMIGKAIIKYWHEINATSESSLATEPSLGPIFFSYGLFIIFIIGLTGLFVSLTKKDWRPLFIALLASPTLLYLFDGHISDDHPWLLRRYTFTLFPLFLFFTVYLWQTWENKLSPVWRNSSALFFFSVIFSFQAWPFLQSLAVIENHTLLQQTEYLSTRFSNKDLLLVDREASGDPFLLLAGPLSSIYGKSAVYFFNPEDLNRIDTKKYERIYLLTPEDSLSLYVDYFHERLLPTEVITFSFDTLAAPKPFAFPEKKRVSQDAILFEVTPAL